MDDQENENEHEKHADAGTDIDEEEEDEDGHKRVVVLGPQVPLKEQLELDKVSALHHYNIFVSDPFRPFSKTKK